MTWEALLHRAETEPINLDISHFGDEWCDGFLAGQVSVLEEIAAGRLEIPAAAAPGETTINKPNEWTAHNIPEFEHRVGAAPGETERTP